MTKTIYGANEIAGALSIMATDILSAHTAEPVLIGIRRGGLVLSDRLAALIGQKIGHAPAQGVIDINLDLDAWPKARERPKVGKTEISFSLDGKRVILVDDVLFTGRTVRAALEALVYFGRPARIELACLVDRGYREMPIHADYVPFKIQTTLEQRVNVHFKGQEGQTEDEVVVE
mgnify:FL=1